MPVIHYFLRLSLPRVSLALLAVLCSGVFASAALAGDETQLIESLNAYRSQAQRCGEQVSTELPPQTSVARPVLPARGKLVIQPASASEELCAG
ncbi:CAP domain-containing protein, partial [Pseudomonas syringae]